jgi:hypothetical protein
MSQAVATGLSTHIKCDKYGSTPRDTSVLHTATTHPNGRGGGLPLPAIQPPPSHCTLHTKFAVCDLQAVLPSAECRKRQGFPLKKIVKYAANRDYSEPLVVNEDRKEAQGRSQCQPLFPKYGTTCTECQNTTLWWLNQAVL